MLWPTIGRAPKADCQSSYEISATGAVTALPPGARGALTTVSSVVKQAPLGGLHAKRVQQVRVDDGRADAERAIAGREIGLAGAERADRRRRSG